MSKGGSTTETSEVAIPAYIEQAAQRNLNKAEQISQLGYVPYYGPDVAAFSPMQNAAFQNTADLSSAFGLSAPTGQNVYGSMGAPTDFGGGVQGYSSAPIYEQALGELERRRPGQYDAITGLFIDPQTGARGQYSAAPVDYTRGGMPSAGGGGGDGQNPFMAANLGSGGGGGYNTSTTSMNTPLSYLRGGVNDPNLTSGLSQFAANVTGGVPGMTRNDDNTYTRTGSAAPATSIRPVARPSNRGLGAGSTSFLSGGGADGAGNFGRVGDFFGGLLSGGSSSGGYSPGPLGAGGYSEQRNNSNLASSLHKPFSDSD